MRLPGWTRSAGLLGSHPAFRRLWWARAVSLLGDRFLLLAMPTLALIRLHATPGQAALLFAAQSLPGAVLALPVAARLVGVSERAVMMICDLVRGLLLAAIVACAAVHRLNLGDLLGAVVAIGLADTVFDVAAQSYVPRIVDRADYGDANSRLAQAASGAWVLGPILAGLVIGAAGPVAALAADAASFGLSWGLLIRIREAAPARMSPADARARPDAAAGDGASIDGASMDAAGLDGAGLDGAGLDEGAGDGQWRRLVSSCRFVAGHAGLRAIIGATALFNLGGAVVGSLYIPYLLHGLRMSPAVIGGLMTTGGISTLCTVLLLRRILAMTRPRVALPVSLLVGSAALWLIPLASRGGAVALLVAYQLVFSAAAVIFGVMSVTVRQTVTPQLQQGRVYAIAAALTGLALPIGGALASVVASAASLVIAIALGCAIASLSLLTVRALTRIGALDSADQRKRPAQNPVGAGHVRGAGST